MIKTIHLENPSIRFPFFSDTLNRVLDIYQTSPPLLIKFISLPPREYNVYIKYSAKSREHKEIIY